MTIRLWTQVLTTVGAEPNARTSDNITPLHWAAGYNDNPGVTQSLIAVGADPKAKDNDGSTPLHRAAEYNDNRL